MAKEGKYNTGKMVASRRQWLMAAVAAACVAIAVWLYFCDPMQARWMPKCVFYALTGWKCPTCGAMRAVHSLLHLRIGEALAFNPMLPVLIGLFIAISWRVLRGKSVTSRATQLLIWAYVIIYAFWWLLRNLLAL